MFAQWSLKTKLIVLCAGMCAVSLGLAVTANFALKRVSGSYQLVSGTVLPQTREIGEMFGSYRRIRILLRTLGLSGISREVADKTVADVKAEIANYERLQKNYLEITDADTPEEKELVDEMLREWTAFKAVGGEVLDLYALGTSEARAKILDIFLGRCPERAKAYTEAYYALRDYQKKEAETAVAKAESDATKANFLSVLMTSVGIIASFVVGLMFSRALSNALDGIAKGLAAQASELNSASRQISNESQTLSSSTTEQAASLQETVASVEEVSSMVGKNAENAKRSETVATSSNEAALKGRETLDEMIRSIDAIDRSNQDISEQIEASNREIAEIVKVISEIGNKTKVINDIVFQTKLLSFNASVEAARAGEHGKGFAVVAEEVGNLAQMSGNAAKEISTMLEGSVQKVESTVESTKKKVEQLVSVGKQRVSEGTETARRCREALEEIVGSVSEVKQLVSEIATASKEQAQGVQEINKAMTQLDQVTQSNASSAQRTASASVQLSAQSEALEGLVRTLVVSVHGSKAQTSASGAPTVSAPKAERSASNVVPMQKSKHFSAAPAKTVPLKLAAGAESLPSSEDARFEDV